MRDHPEHRRLPPGGRKHQAIELHGTNRTAVCAQKSPIDEVRRTVDAGNLDPRCDACASPVKPATISFGQAMPVPALEKAFTCASRCSLFLMIGSSLQVEPAASMHRAARQAGADLLFINRTATSSDNPARVLFRENAGEYSTPLRGISARSHDDAGRRCREER